MNIREYLQQIRLLDIKINQRMMEKNDLECIASRFPKIRKHCEELAAGIDKVISDLVNRKDSIISHILMLKDHRYSDVLFLHYARYLQLEDVAAVMMKSTGKGYTYQYINCIHSDALKELKNLLQ